jgi:hypothetical protein
MLKYPQYIIYVMWTSERFLYLLFQILQKFGKISGGIVQIYKTIELTS